MQQIGSSPTQPADAEQSPRAGRTALVGTLIGLAVLVVIFAVALLQAVGIPEPEARLASYPHQMSGGQCQRVMIAMAIACEPRLLIADEPTTALDVTIQKQILDLLLKLQLDRGMALILITHDMGVVAETADRVVVQYRGRKMEEADVLTLFERPATAYTRALLAALPENATGERLPTVDELMGREAGA